MPGLLLLLQRQSGIHRKEQFHIAELTIGEGCQVDPASVDIGSFHRWSIVKKQVRSDIRRTTARSQHNAPVTAPRLL